MAKNSAIEWTDHTFNPWWGCTKVSPACDHCYAERDARRFAKGRVLWGVDAERRIFDDRHWKAPTRWNDAARAAGKRARVFCASMADVFDKHAPEGARDRLWQLIWNTPHLDWLLLTKRVGNVATMVPPEWLHMNTGRTGHRWPDNAWLGITVVNQTEAERDIPKLLELPAPVRFLSIEPMLGRIDLEAACDIAEQRICAGREWAGMVEQDAHACWMAHRYGSVKMLDWVICGGESGPKARPMHPDWVRSLRNQCADAGVPFLFKQWGEWLPGTHYTAELQERDPSPDQSRYPCAQLDDPLSDTDAPEWQIGYTHALDTFDEGALYRVGRKAAGRLFEGEEHNGQPRRQP